MKVSERMNTEFISIAAGIRAILISHSQMNQQRSRLSDISFGSGQMRFSRSSKTSCYRSSRLIANHCLIYLSRGSAAAYVDTKSLGFFLLLEFSPLHFSSVRFGLVWFGFCLAYSTHIPNKLAFAFAIYYILGNTQNRLRN